jgi:nitrogen fixation protein
MSDSIDLEEEVVVVEKEEKTNPTTGKQNIVRNGWTVFMATVEISTPT